MADYYVDDLLTPVYQFELFNHNNSNYLIWVLLSERERETERDRERHRETEGERQRETERDTERHRETQRERQRETQREKYYLKQEAANIHTKTPVLRLEIIRDSNTGDFQWRLRNF